jgi:hypothetical protein
MRVDLFKCAWNDSRSSCGTTLGRADEEAILRRERLHGRETVRGVNGWGKDAYAYMRACQADIRQARQRQCNGGPQVPENTTLAGVELQPQGPSTGVPRVERQGVRHANERTAKQYVWRLYVPSSREVAVQASRATPAIDNEQWCGPSSRALAGALLRRSLSHALI